MSQFYDTFEQWAEAMLESQQKRLDEVIKMRDWLSAAAFERDVFWLKEVVKEAAEYRERAAKADR